MLMLLIFTGLVDLVPVKSLRLKKSKCLLSAKGKRDKTRLSREWDVGYGSGMPVFEGWFASKVLRPAVSEEIRDGDPCGSKNIRVIDVLETMQEPGNGHVEITASLPKKVMGSVAQLKYIYMNAHSMSDKQEELEAIAHQDSYDTFAIMETHNWRAALDRYKLFRRDEARKEGWCGSPVC